MIISSRLRKFLVHVRIRRIHNVTRIDLRDASHFGGRPSHFLLYHRTQRTTTPQHAKSRNCLSRLLMNDHEIWCSCRTRTSRGVDLEKNDDESRNISPNALLLRPSWGIYCCLSRYRHHLRRRLYYGGRTNKKVIACCMLSPIRLVDTRALTHRSRAICLVTVMRCLVEPYSALPFKQYFAGLSRPNVVSLGCVPKRRRLVP